MFKVLQNLLKCILSNTFKHVKILNALWLLADKSIENSVSFNVLSINWTNVANRNCPVFRCWTRSRYHNCRTRYWSDESIWTRHNHRLVVVYRMDAVKVWLFWLNNHKSTPWLVQNHIIQRGLPASSLVRKRSTSVSQQFQVQVQK